MSVSIGSSSQAINAYTSVAAANSTAIEDSVNEETSRKAPEEAEAAVYESNSLKGSHALDADMIKAMKDELEQRTQNLVQQMLGKQMDALTTADESFWQKFRTGEFTATQEQIEQAQRDIADDGYWGVDQTSERIVKYAVALSGGDPDKLDTMISAFEKGFQAATKTWGGELPDLAHRTRDAVLSKFEDLKKQYAGQTDEVSA